MKQVATSGKTWRILIVDDDCMIVNAVGKLTANIVQKKFTNTEVIAKEAGSAEEAIGWMRSIEPDILLFDHHFDDGDQNGFDLVRKARNGLSAKIKKMISITSDVKAGCKYQNELGVEWIFKSDFHKMINSVLEFISQNNK